ncbi:MAG: PLP-dependent aminotransferase family protein, partial [bacterium]|nr:PLP-dependent aminotransferase family protein [bacterium]
MRTTALLIPLDRAAATPLHRQVYRGLREAILAGRLLPGQAVPSTRALAAEMELSRNTVQAAFDQLISEGYLEGRVGAGTRVAATLPAELLARRRAPPSPAQPRAPRLSRRGMAMAQSAAPSIGAALSGRAFHPGIPAVDAFPFDVWSRYVARRLRGCDGRLAGYGDPAGEPSLRESIALHLRTTRAVACESAQVIVTEGTQQTLDLIARAVFDEGDALWVEDPGYPGARAAFGSAGLKLVAVPIDAYGIDVAAGRRRSPRASGVYVTPSHQYPLGGVQSLARRLELLAWARESDAWVIEDDYDSEFRFGGHPLASLQGLDEDGRVLYVGTFSKVLFPALRLGYVIVPPAYAETFARARAATARCAAAPVQAALADFMRDGLFAAHLRRMRSIYTERRACFLEELDRRLRGIAEPRDSGTGLHVTCMLSEDVDDCLLARRAREAGVDAPPLRNYAIEPQPRG